MVVSLSSFALAFAMTATGLGFATVLSTASIRLNEYKYREIEGLRGLLAFWVFIHHTYVWKIYASTGEWSTPSDHLFAHLGKSSVAVFFMITAFLFTDRLIDRNRSIRWSEFAVARLFRLFPAYLIAAAFVFLLALLKSGFELKVAPIVLLRQAVQWGGLGLFGAPDVNQVVDTGLMIAMVSWSLPFEVLFYLTLPIAGIALSKRPAPFVAFTCVALTAFLLSRGMDLLWLLAFLPGVAAAVIVRSAAIAAFVRSTPFAFTCAVLVLAGIWKSTSFFEPLVFAGLSGLFASVASGNSLWGVLRSRGADFLGRISYSVYLFHGLVLYVAADVILGLRTIAEMDGTRYGLLMTALGCVVISVAFLVFQRIEAPGIAFGHRIIAAMRRQKPAVVDAAEVSEPTT